MDYAKLTVEELYKKLAEKQEALRKFRFDVAGSKIKNVKEGQNAKKEIARILTVINSKVKPTAQVADK